MCCLKRDVHHELRGVGSIEGADTLCSIDAASAFDAATKWTECHLHALLDNFGGVHDEIVHDCRADAGEAVAEDVRVAIGVASE